MLNTVEVSNSTVIVTIIGGVVGILLSILVYKLKSPKELFIERCKRDGSVVQATAVKSTFIRGDDESTSHNKRANRKRVRYEYVVNGRTYHKTFTYQAGGRASVHYPNTITLYYRSGNPRIAIRAVHKSPAPGCLLGLLVMLGAMLISHFVLQ